MKSDKDSTFERLVKLLQSVMQLVISNQRSLNIFCAELQKVVFEQSGHIPPYKDWKQICKLHQFNWFVMMGIATLDATTDGKVDVNDWRVQQLIAAYPECFSDEPSVGPVPLSLIRQLGYEAGRQNHKSSIGGVIPVSFDAIPDHIPVQIFDKFGNNRANLNGDILPEGIDPNSPQGAIVEWKGKKFVVLENNQSCEELCIAPAELIDVTL